MACKLQRVEGQRGVYTPQSIQDLQNFIRDAFIEAIDASDGGYDAKRLKINLRKALHKIGDEYNDLRQINEVVRQVELVINDPEFEGMNLFLPQDGIFNNVSTTNRRKIVEDSEQEIDNQVSNEEIKQVKSSFLDDFLGNKAKLKNQLKQDVLHRLITTFVVDRENGRLVANIAAANKAARDYKQHLFNQVMSYFKTYMSEQYNVSDITLFDGDKYTGILSEVRNLTRYLDDFSPEQLQAIHDSDINKYNAITAWFTLKNFDSFVDLLMGDAIKVNPEYKNSFKDGDGYIYSSKGSQVITSYRKDENIVLENEIGALAQSLINSTPFYKRGIDNPTGKFIKFEDFYKVITKLKDLSLDPESGKIIINRLNYGFLFGPDSDLTLQEQQLIENKSLRSIINNIRINPQVYTRLAMRMLIQGSNMDTLGYTEEEMDKAYSVYKGFFERKNITPNHKGYSLYTIQHQDLYDHNDKNYYSLITQVADSLFTVNYLQYNLTEDGGIVVRTLHDLASDNIRKKLEMNITGFNSKHIIKTGFEKQLIEPYKLNSIYDETTKKFTGINFSIPLESDLVTDIDRTIHITLSDLGLVMTIKDAQGNILNVEDLEGLIYDDIFRKFIDDQLNLDLQTDSDLLEALQIVYGNKGSGVIARELLELASNVYMNKYVSNVLLKDISGKKATMKKLDAIYPGNELTYNSTLGEVNLISQNKLPILQRIASAKSITTGEAQSTQVRDAEGNMLSSQTLSRLLGSLQSQWQRILENPSSAASGFSLLQTNLFKGCYTTKEYKSLNGSKSQTQFTVAESIQGNFLHDFVTGFLSFDDRSGKKIIGNGVVGLLPSVNSDKNTIGRMLLDLSQECNVQGIPSIQIAGRNKTWAELSIDELQQIIALELGNSYKKAYANVLSDFKNLQLWLLEKGVDVNIDPSTHFRELNEYCENAGISTALWLYQQTLAYNKTHAKPIQLIEQTHYIQNGNGIKFNNTFNALMKRYSDPIKLKEFFDLKRTEMLKSLVEENVEINLFDDNSKNSPKAWLRENYPDWVHKTDSEGTTIKNGKMTLAKITLSNGRTFGITSKADLKQLSTALLETNPGTHVDFIANPHKLLNPKFGLKIELHPMLDKYNTLDYLFTLEFMIAGVGSHINHPGKAKYKTPIVWAHPAIGKTWALDEAKYGNQILDWDVEFNRRRDAWIVKHSGIALTDPLYKAIRNEYMINWANHPDYKNFVKAEWNRVKLLANSQNKMLVASPHMLLQMFPEDFNKVITMSLDDFVARNVARKANNEENSIEWKKGIDSTISVYSSNPVNKSKVITVDSGIYLTDLMQNGTLYNETALLRENEMQEEAARFLALHKRNVSYTAAMHEFLLGSVTGIPTVYNMAIIDDIKAPVYTISGDRGNHAPFDGATFVNPFVVIWENNSLEGDKAGIDKKQFVHYYDEATGTGGIVKTAGFGLTNDRIKRYKFYRDMMYNMTSRVWKNSDGTTHIVREGGILKDFNGKDVDYGKVYFKKGNKYYMRTIDAYLGNNTYSTTLVEVNENGEAEGELLHDLLISGVNSNYAVWQMFGGHNSMELRNGKLVPSENSMELTARAANNYGIKKPGINKVITADDLDQPMKHSDIHYMPTVGAIKQGSCNVNPKSCYYGHHDLNFMQVKMYQAGIQLDKEHHADQSELSVMTQVISAACANGYNSATAKRLYDSIYALTKAGTREFRNELGNLLVGDEAKFNQAVTGIIMKAMMNATSQDGDLVQAIALDLIKLMRTSKDFSFSPEFYEKADLTIPASDPTVYPKIINMLTVALTKSGIKAKISGILAVLCPSHEILKFYKIPAFDENGEPTGKYKRVTIDKLEEFYNTDDVDTILNLLLDEETFLEHPSDIEIGWKYLVTHSDGTQEVIHINRIHGKTQNFGFREHNGKQLRYSEVSYEDFRKMDLAVVQEWVKEGQDLKSYNVRLEDEEGNKYQIADLDIVSDYFEVKDEEDSTELFKKAFNLLDKYGKRNELIGRIRKDLDSVWGTDGETQILIDSLNGNADTVLQVCDSFNSVTNPNLGKDFKEYLSRRIIHFLNREMLIALNGISPSSAMDTVMINDKPVKIKKDSIKTSAYGLVMPKTFKTNLGLDDFDDLEDIKNDPMFFVKKLAKKFGTHVESYELEDGTVINNFHLELKKSNGNHIYIREGLVGSDLSREVQWFKRTDESGNVYRVNGDNEVMYQMHSADDKIYIDDEGNEIIVTTGDKVIWTDEDGNELNVASIEPVLNENGVWVDAKTGNKLIRKLDSGILFYLDSMDYSSFNISEASTDDEFKNILSKASNSVNQNTAKLASRIQNWGKGNNVLKLVALRNLVQKMNNYEAMLQDAELKDFAMQHLKELGLLMHTSFLRSLEIIAARIPAQSLLSFMSMQVEAYENPDINSAYVSLFQFYLLGSDLDIDAVSLQTFSLGRNGLYVGHSPYYNLNNEELRKASDLIPFPTGMTVSLNKEIATEYKNSTLGRMLMDGLLGFKYKEGGQSVFNLDTREDGTVNVTLNLDSVENIAKFSEFIENINKIGFVNTTVAEYQNLANDLSTKFEGTGVLTLKMIASVISQVQDIVNKHNMFIEKAKPNKREQIIKNYITAQLREIIDDPINRRLADSSVDVVTGPAKALAKLSPKATVQTTFTPGNVVNKFQSIAENMVGKDGIAICATGLKSFFALTEMYLEILNSETFDEKQSLLFDVKFGGKSYVGLANGFALNFKSSYEYNLTEEERLRMDEIFPAQIQDYLLEQFWASDAANEMSALLGLSTDNAKELVLAKINAGTASIGMYLYGLSIGIPFNLLYNIMTSPLAFRLTELTKGDMFNDNNGTFNIVGALQYLKEEPIRQLLRFNNVDVSEIEGIDNPVLFFLQQLFLLMNARLNDDKLQETVKNNGSIRTLLKIFGSEDVNNAKRIINEMRSDVLTLLNSFKDKALFERYEVAYNQILDFVILYIDDVNLIPKIPQKGLFGAYDLYEDLEILATGAEEMKLLGKILRLNQEIKTNGYDLIGLVNNIEEAIIRRARQIQRLLRRKGITKRLFKGSDIAKKIVFCRNLDADLNEGGFRINLEQFMTNPEYAKRVIDLYDEIKLSYNPLKVLKVVPHYRGYAETLLNAYKGAKNRTVKFKVLTDKVRHFCNLYDITNNKLQKQVTKNAEKAVDLYLRRSWMKESIKPITISPLSNGKPVYMFIDSGSEARVLTYKTEIQLGTELGDANFKLWMETVVIPELRRNNPDNLFLNRLQPIVNTRTNLGSVAVNYGLPINMLPKTDYERDVFNEHKDAFNDLQSVKSIYGMNVQDLLFYYSLISNDGRVGPNSLHGIFEDYITTHGSKAKEYNLFISKADASSDTYQQILKYITDEMLAPSASPYTTGTRIIKYKDTDSDKIEIYIKEVKEVKEESSYDELAGYDEFAPIDDDWMALLDILNDWDSANNYDPKQEIKGFKRNVKKSMHGSDNRNYFYNPVAIEGLVESSLLVLNLQELEMYPYLAKYGITIGKIKDGFGVMDVTVNDPSLKPVIDRFIEFVKKDKKGILTSMDAKDLNDNPIKILDKKQLDAELKVIENNCI